MWLGIAAKLVPGILKTGMSIAANRRKTKELDSKSEITNNIVIFYNFIFVYLGFLFEYKK